MEFLLAWPMKLLVWIVLAACVPLSAAQDAEALRFINKHATQMDAAVTLVQRVIMPSLLQVHIGPFSM